MRRVLLFACETRFPFIGFLPVTSQTRGMATPEGSRKGANCTRKAPPDGRLEEPPLGERQALVSRDDEMVQHLDFDQRQRFLQLPGQELVGPARLRDASRMVVREEYSRRVRGERRFHDLARVDAGLRQRAAE